MKILIDTEDINIGIGTVCGKERIIDGVLELIKKEKLSFYAAQSLLRYCSEIILPDKVMFD